MMEVERPPQTSLELYQSWRRYGILGHDTQAILRPINRTSSLPASASSPSSAAGSLALISLRAESSPSLNSRVPRKTYTSLWKASSGSSSSGGDFRSSSKNTTSLLHTSSSSPPPPSQQVKSHKHSTTTTTSSTFPFHAPAKLRSTAAARFHFPPQPPARPRRGTKRCRHTSDVDGPHTADLSSKKRRLRGQLITSRLSQPFSQPATHILNREGLEAGDKRFLKLAGSIDSARRVGHLHTSSFLRFSVMNRLRRRLDIGRPSRTHEEEAKKSGHGMPVLAQSPQLNSGGKYLKPSAKTASMHETQLQHTTSSTSTSTPHSSRAQSSHNRSIHHTPKPPTCRLSKPTALPMPSSDTAAALHRTAPQIHPIPAPDAAKPARSMYDDFDEDCFAFLHSEDEGSGSLTDDPEDVYCDFGAIFGETGDGDGLDGEDHTYEEYFDELDGISWATR